MVCCYFESRGSNCDVYFRLNSGSRFSGNTGHTVRNRQIQNGIYSLVFGQLSKDSWYGLQLEQYSITKAPYWAFSNTSFFIFSMNFSSFIWPFRTVCPV